MERPYNSRPRAASKARGNNNNGTEYGHIVTAERVKGRLIIYDPQRNTFLNLRNALAHITPGSAVELPSIDRFLVIPDVAAAVLTEADSVP